MNWDDVRLFLCVAQQGSYRKAAALLTVGHSTLSRRIDALEQNLGSRLFNRVDRGLRLTAAGDEMVKTATVISEAMAALQLNISNQDQLPLGKITLTGPEFLIEYFLLDAIENFCQRWPEINIELNGATAIVNIADIEADIAIRITQTPDEQLIGRKLGPYCEAVYASKDYLHAFAKAPDYHRFISPSENYSLQTQLNAKYRAPIKTQLITADIATQLKSAVNGFGIACLPCLVGDQTAQLIRISPITNRADIWLLAHSDSRHNKRMSLLRNYLTGHFEVMQDRLIGNKPRGH